MKPTIRQVFAYYQQIAKVERMKCGRPGVRTVTNAVRGASLVCKAAGVDLSASVDSLTRQAFDAALAAFLSRGVTRITAWSYVGQLRAVFAKWTRPYYEDCGWEIPALALPTFRARAPRYERPNEDLLRNVKVWYKTLDGEVFGEGGRMANPVANDHKKERLWLVVTLMLEFAMRNGDILRLRPENFVASRVQVEPDGHRRLTRFLSYTPHKTELSSGRQVRWPIHEQLWTRLGPLVSDGDRPGSALIRTIDSGVFVRLNRQMRSLGFRGGKGAYELRKICIDHIYQRFGAEMAVSISGDDIKTISRYYADPSAANVVGVRVVDLL